jgi:hypothetical protein
MSDSRMRADESVAPRFTRVMRAATSPLGVLTDPPWIGVVESVLVIGAIVAYQTGAVTALPALYALVSVPLLVALGANLALLGARAKVVTWLAGVPFPIDNVNGLLNGVAQHLLLRFEGKPPSRDVLNERLESVHPDCFALEFHPEEPEVEVRIGVLDTKLNPVGAQYRRYSRVQLLVEQCLVPLHAEHPIESVRVC